MDFSFEEKHDDRIQNQNRKVHHQEVQKEITTNHRRIKKNDERFIPIVLPN